MPKILPNPGSEEAIEQGCICPVLDNDYGAGYLGKSDVFVYTEGCSVHPWHPWHPWQGQEEVKEETIEEKKMEIKINGKPIETKMVDGVQRLPCNSVIRYMLDTHPDFDMNRMAYKQGHGDFSEDEVRMIYQNIGYSVCGYSDIFPDDEIENPLWGDD